MFDEGTKSSFRSRSGDVLSTKGVFKVPAGNTESPVVVMECMNRQLPQPKGTRLSAILLASYPLADESAGV